MKFLSHAAVFVLILSTVDSSLSAKLILTREETTSIGDILDHAIELRRSLLID